VEKNMKRVLLAILAIGTLAAPLAAVTSAQAQVPPRNGPYGDRDRDGIPNAYDRHDNRGAYNGAWGDRDHDGVPNKYDRHDNRALRDSDHDGVPNAYDRNAHNPYVR
jgi:Ni/Co efflux regulator RcnB